MSLLVLLSLLGRRRRRARPYFRGAAENRQKTRKYVPAESDWRGKEAAVTKGSGGRD
jgi:hypothetical protein